MPKKNPIRSNAPPGRVASETMQPFSMRISRLTYDRLLALRAVDDLTVMEHARRALDYYLEHAEVSLALAASEGFHNAVTAAASLDADKSSLLPKLMATHAPMPRRSQARIIQK